MVEEKTDIRQVTQANVNGSLRICLPKNMIKALKIQKGDLLRFISNAMNEEVLVKKIQDND